MYLIEIRPMGKLVKRGRTVSRGLIVFPPVFQQILLLLIEHVTVLERGVGFEGIAHPSRAVFLQLAVYQGLKVHIGDFLRIHGGVYRSHTQSTDRDPSSSVLL